jgi:hypothetical protein
MQTPVVLCEISGKPLASGWLTDIDGHHGALAIRRGEAALRAAYFLDGSRNVVCRTGNLEREGRLHTRWADNHRIWTVAFAGPVTADGMGASATPRPVAAA